MTPMPLDLVHDYPVPRSAMPGIVWPAVPHRRDAAAFALLAQFEMSQWWPAEVLQLHQLAQATEVLRHAARTVPFYRDLLGKYSNRTTPLTLAEWQSIPLLKRTDIQEAAGRLTTSRPLEEHGGGYQVETSGSTGAPVRVTWNETLSRFHTALTLRDHLWHRRDPSLKMGVIKWFPEELSRAQLAEKEARWAPGYRSGPMVFFDLRSPVDEALEWLAREDPDYLIVYPTYLRNMILRAQETSFKPAALREVATVSEVVDPDLRALCQEDWNAQIVDMYSAQEVGFIALECPETAQFHIQSECNFVEVLDETGAACAPGEIGRVVVTALHNFATPLIRYDLGDFAEVGPPCSCGRGLPVLRSIQGRARNMMRLPDGSRQWVALIGCGLEDIAAISQMQLVQTSFRQVSLRLVVSRPLSEAEAAVAREAVIRLVRHECDVTLDYVEEIPRSASGKFEVVMCEIEEAEC